MTEAPDILREIVATRRRRLGVEVVTAPVVRSAVGSLSRETHPFLAAVAAPGPSIIAEVKLGSPRLGDLRGRVDPEGLARRYAAAGARALSVVVEPDHFFGSYEVLERCRRASGLPALAKDFVVSEEQLDAAAAAGATAALLIAALFEPADLVPWAEAARVRGLAPLVEVHSRSDLERLGDDLWELVGVNNRDLRTFEVDIERSLRLRRALPRGTLTVAESGLSRPGQIRRLSAAGFDAFLIGEALLLADDPVGDLRRLAGSRPEPV